MAHSVIIVEDERTLAKNIRTFLTRQGFAVRAATTAEQGLRLWEDSRPDVLLLDYQLGDGNGLDLLRQIRADDTQTKVVLMTAHGDVRLAVDAMKAGANDYLSKPLVLEELRLMLEKLIKQERMAGALAYYQSREAERSGLEKLLGESAPMRDVREKLRLFIEAERQMPSGEPPPAALITGATGTGKELVARALHFDGARCDKPFIEINCAALPAHTVEAELFGYERGAFTDARRRKLGLAETADGGTLFLDEIGELDLAVQAKLLRVLEDRRVRRLGGVSDQQVDIRVVAATNQSLEQRVQQRSFRADLLFRLRVIHIELPPLSARGNDIQLLANHFLAQHSKRYGRPGIQFAEETLALLRQHVWPGNVRELRNLIEHAIILLGSNNVIMPEQINLGTAPVLQDGATAPIISTRHPLNLEQLELTTVSKALEQTGRNITRAADLLGISRDALRYRMQKHGMAGKFSSDGDDKKH